MGLNGKHLCDTVTDFVLFLLYEDKHEKSKISLLGTRYVRYFTFMNRKTVKALARAQGNRGKEAQRKEYHL